MRNLLIITVLFAVTSMTAHAQLEKGTVLLGTSTTLLGAEFSILPEGVNQVGLSFGSTKYKSDNFDGESESITAFNLGPKVGFFIVDNGLLGVDLSFAYYKTEGMDDPVTGFNFSPFFRYYFPGENFTPFVQVKGGIGQVSFGSDDNDKNNLINFGIGGGGAIFVGEKVSIDLMAGFNHQEAKDKDNTNNARSIANLFGIAAGVSVFL